MRGWHTGLERKTGFLCKHILLLGYFILPNGVEFAQDVDKILGSHTPNQQWTLRNSTVLLTISVNLSLVSKWANILSALTKKNVAIKWVSRTITIVVTQAASAQSNRIILTLQAKKLQNESENFIYALRTGARLCRRGRSFENIGRLARNTPIYKPIDHTHPDLVADASKQGLSGYYGSGKHYKTMAPAEFHSRAFHSAESNYPTHDKEMLAIAYCGLLEEMGASIIWYTFRNPH